MLFNSPKNNVDTHNIKDNHIKYQETLGLINIDALSN